MSYKRHSVAIKALALPRVKVINYTVPDKKKVFCVHLGCVEARTCVPSGPLMFITLTRLSACAQTESSFNFKNAFML